MSIVMNNWNFPLSLNILEPLCLNPDTAVSSRSKPATLFHNEREHVFNLRLTGCTYLGRSEFGAEGKNTIKDVFGYLWSGGWIPIGQRIREFRSVRRFQQTHTSRLYQ